MKISLASALLLATVTACAHRQEDVTVTLLSMSDYHSHAVPFYSEGKPRQAGLSRAIAFLKAARQQPHTFVISSGDTMNLGTPTWSDEYKCIEWSWFNGLVDVMALGNHDLDYGAEEFQRCRESITYPLISSNFVGQEGAPLLQPGGKPYVVQEFQGVRIGFFAIAGNDYTRLVRKEWLPAGASFKDAITEGQATVRTLRETEKVHAVVFIGHQHREDDEAMARAVPGIDVIFGSHSHLKSELTQIPGTSTWYISPFQYLTYLARVRLRFQKGQLQEVSGNLVKMDETQPEDAETTTRVQQLQQQLVARRPERFEVLGQAALELSDARITTSESLIGNWGTGVLRAAVGTHAFFSTASSFRAALPPGDITVETFYTAIPYKNALVTAEVSGEQLASWVAYSVSRRGFDNFSQQTGVRYRLVDGKPVDIQVLKDPANPAAGYAPLQPSATYRLGTTDFQAFIAAGYKDLFSAMANPVRTALDAHTLLIQALRNGPITATLDGRTGDN